MAKGNSRSNREIRKPKKSAAERSAAKIENIDTSKLLKSPKSHGKRKP